MLISNFALLLDEDYASMKSLIGQKHNRPIMNVQDCLDKKVEY